MTKLDDKDLTKVAAGEHGGSLGDAEPDTGDSGSQPVQVDGGDEGDIHDLPGRGGGYRGAE